MKIVRPYIETPFIPQEVDRLSELKRKKIGDTSMTNAILLGPPQQRSGLVEVNKLIKLRNLQCIVQ